MKDFVLPEPFRTVDAAVKRAFESAWKEIQAREALQSVTGDTFVTADRGWDEAELPRDTQVCFGQMWTRSVSALKDQASTPSTARSLRAKSRAGASKGPAAKSNSVLSSCDVSEQHKQHPSWRSVLELPSRAAGLPKFAIIPLRAWNAGPRSNEQAAGSQPANAKAPELALFVYHPTTHVYMCLPVPSQNSDVATASSQAAAAKGGAKWPILDQGVLPLPQGCGPLQGIMGLVGPPRTHPYADSGGHRDSGDSGKRGEAKHGQSASGKEGTEQTLSHVAVVCKRHFVLFEAGGLLRAARAKSKGRPKSRATPALQLLHPIGGVPTKTSPLSTVQDQLNQQVFLAEPGRARVSVVSLKDSKPDALKQRPILLSGSVQSVSHCDDGLLVFGLSNGNISIFTLQTSMKPRILRVSRAAVASVCAIHRECIFAADARGKCFEITQDCKKRVWAVAEVVSGQRPLRRGDNRVTAVESFAQAPLGAVRVSSTQAAFLLPSIVRIHTRGQRDRCVLLECPEPPEGGVWEDIGWEKGEVLLSCQQAEHRHVCSFSSLSASVIRRRREAQS